MTLNQENTQTCSSHTIISHRKFLNVSVRKGQSSGIQTKAVTHKTKLATFVQSLHSVKEPNS
jgi:hypothetical protein